MALNISSDAYNRFISKRIGQADKANISAYSNKKAFKEGLRYMRTY